MVRLPDFSHDPVAVFINDWIYDRPAAERLYPDIWALELAEALRQEFGLPDGCLCNVGVQECPLHPDRLFTKEQKIAFRKWWDEKVGGDG